MERYFGSLQPAIRSHRFPYASIDRYVVEDAQLTQIKVVYNCAEELALRPPRHAATRAYSSPFCEYTTSILFIYTLTVAQIHHAYYFHHIVQPDLLPT